MLHFNYFHFFGEKIFSLWLSDKQPACNAGDAGNTGLTLGLEDSLEKKMATYFSILAWEIPLTEVSGGIQSMGWKRVRHGLATKQQQQNNNNKNYKSN